MGALRQIVLDTETTGKDAKRNRIIEIGAVELIDRVPTGRVFHKYLNPQGTPIEDGAFKVHGLSAEFLADKPTFKAVSDEFCAFVHGAQLLIHNADFDIGFLNEEFKRIGKNGVWDVVQSVECTLKMSKSISASKRSHSLDNLCIDYGVDKSARNLHGALLDAQLLTEVYLKMTDGVAPFIDDEQAVKEERRPVAKISRSPGIRIGLSAADEQAHFAFLAQLEKDNKAPPVYLAASEKPAAGPKP